MTGRANATFAISAESLVGQRPYEEVIACAAEVYASCGALVLTEEIVAPPKSWRRNLLGKAEVDRLDGFLFDRDRLLYLAAHSLKRLMLAAVTRRAAKDLLFCTSGPGRPFLMVSGWQGDFNLSHSGNRVALAVVARGRVGVDVQEPGGRYADMHEKLRHPDEIYLFPDKSDFLQMWTLKESVSKAIGTGLSENFETLKIETAPRRAGQYFCGGWACRHAELEDGYHLSVATDRARMPARPYRLEDFVR